MPEEPIAGLGRAPIRARPKPGIINLSLGVYTINNQPPLGLSTIIAEMSAKGLIFVASAGNDTSCRPSYPAALPEVVGVGAIGPFGPAWFTNYGDWVDASAPGVEILGKVPDPFGLLNRTGDGSGDGPVLDLRKDLGEPARQGSSLVSWSGTSFAAPAVVGAIGRAAVRLIDKGVTVVDALEEAKYEVVDEPTLLRWSGLGTIVNQSPSFVPVV